MSNIGSVFNTAFAPLVSIVGDIITWLQDLSCKLSTGFNNIGTGIGNMWQSINDGFVNVGTGISNIWQSVKDGFLSVGTGIANMWESIKGLPALITDGIKSLFIPTNEGHQANSELIKNAINSKFLFIENFKTALGNLNAIPTQMNIPIKWGSFETNLSLAWYEPHRIKIKSGISTIFFVATALSIFHMISGAFGLGLGRYVSSGVNEDNKGVNKR